ncbi:uncharacterized protein LOC103182503 [Callorhinchus milii]|uniref:uncharacterized protein LOC103182503 n=1 Tax=Callorhinchus milii TaxID=7868 RepID=UPI0004574DB0|nr:uncharacterized protein LOC103182503 [Callorhinchus milii]|eukprot:gi/632937224/ref/XP_007897754.1/ PREDICTED: uncharacterized protein LOC103182503 [Callorhinchus milii]
MMGFDPQLTEAQFKVLAECYTDPLLPDHILWHKFSKDMDLVFTIPELEKKPKLKLPPQEDFQLPKVGATDADNLEVQQRELFEATMCRFKQRISHRNLLTYQDFADFDKFNHGHVTGTQFRRCLTQLGLQATEEEVNVIEEVFSDEMGFNYIKFLEEVDPQLKPERRYEKLMSDIHKLNAAKRNLEVGASSDIDCILAKIKTKVYRERMRLDEHMRDFDRLHSGRILKVNFRRALDLNEFELQPSEVAILEKRYESCNKPDYVDYKLLFDDIESIFTLKNLEKFPLAEVTQFKPPEDWTLNELSTEDEIAYLEAVARLAAKVRKKQLQLFPLFEDYDTIHIGRISQSQFHRVLTELDLDNVLSLKDIRAIRQKFRVKVGSRDDVDYIAFCDAVYDAACMNKRMP